MDIFKNERWYPFLIALVVYLGYDILSIYHRFFSDILWIFTEVSNWILIAFFLKRSHLIFGSSATHNEDGYRQTPRWLQTIVGMVILICPSLSLATSTNIVNRLPVQPLLMFSIYYLTYRKAKIPAAICAGSLTILLWVKVIWEVILRGFDLHFFPTNLCQLLISILLLFYTLSNHKPVGIWWFVICCILCTLAFVYDHLLQRPYFYLYSYRYPLLMLIYWTGFLPLLPKKKRTPHGTQPLSYLEQYKKDHNL